MDRKKIYFETPIEVSSDLLLDVFIEKLQKIKEDHISANSVRISWMTRYDDIEFTVSGYEFETEEQAAERFQKDAVKKQNETLTKLEHFNKLKEELEKEGVL